LLELPPPPHAAISPKATRLIKRRRFGEVIRAASHQLREASRLDIGLGGKSERMPARRLAPLDGVRGVAVAAVLLFHADVAWAAGGYLGVDVFFVLSGFLITSLLLTELDRTGTVDLAQFWTRRLRRLLPALGVLVVACVALAPVMAPLERVADLREDALATIAQIANWRLIDTVGTTLVGAVRSPFQHCWSLAIEMQFYLVWPVVMFAVAGRGRARRSGRWEVGVVAAILAVASIIAMAELVGPGWHTQRSYYGTDARAQALLIGALLAAVLGDHRALVARASVTLRRALGAAGTVCALGLLIAFHAAPNSGHDIYRGWYAVIATASAVVIAAVVVVPGTALARLLSARPLTWLGGISYSLYLWHWPMFMLGSPGRTHLTGTALLSVRVLASLLVASMSHRFVEDRYARSRAAQRVPAVKVLAARPAS
jgi:peptidoglycan/LPS O-acetylase OafA/YrhL